MATSTTHGFRKPEVTDPVRDGAAAVANLADDIESRVGIVQSGRININPASGASDVVQLVFPIPFPTGVLPCVTGSMQSSNPEQWSAVTISGANNLGCNLRVRRVSGTAAATPIQWIAAG